MWSWPAFSYCAYIFLEAMTIHINPVNIPGIQTKMLNLNILHTYQDCYLLLLLLLLRRYNFREVLAFSTSFFHLVRFLMQSFQFVIFILVISLFTSSSHLFLGLPSNFVSAGDHSDTFLTCCYLAYDVRVRTKLIFVLWCSLRCFYYQSVCLVLHSI